MNDANGLAANWLRSAVDTIAQKNASSLPVEAIQKFLKDRSNNAKARRLAYELIAQAQPTRAAKLIQDMLDDPSVELEEMLSSEFWILPKPRNLQSSIARLSMPHAMLTKLI